MDGPKVQYVLRTSPCCKHPQLVELDNFLRSAVTQICNVSLSDDQWTQASLPVRSGGLGVRSVSTLASSAFLASAASTQSLQNRILHKCQVEEEETSASLLNWKSLSASEGLVNPQRISQRAWDIAVAKQTFQSLLDSSTEQFHRARLLAAAAAQSGD